MSRVFIDGAYHDCTLAQLQAFDKAAAAGSKPAVVKDGKVTKPAVVVTREEAAKKILKLKSPTKKKEA